MSADVTTMTGIDLKANLISRRAERRTVALVRLGPIIATAFLFRAAVGADGTGGGKISPVVPQFGPAEWGANASGPLCGIYAACTAVNMAGLEAHPRDFIAAKYVGQCAGSSPEELAAVVEDAGARAQILSRLSVFDLHLARCPVIANVRMTAARNRFDHWVVAIPSEAGVTIFDGIQNPYHIKTAEFLGTWSGIGICVTRDQQNPLATIWLGRSALMLAGVALGATFFFFFANGVSARNGLPRLYKQSCGLCAASVALAVAGNAVFGDLSNHAKGVAVATAPSQSRLYREGTLDDVRKAAAGADMLLVDARREQDYRLGTISRAVNVPVTASLWEIDRYLKAIGRDTPIVVFCQSANCDYDETVGAELTTLGFTDVTVCNEGYAELTKSQELARGL
ncbi:MAG TPA: rhodanese-like domain-containing protein [Pirellulales bacterium]|nr:rhodanese-like domain-containing protein [Pirellulales bacterium]